MNKIIWLILALIVPSLGMAQKQTHAQKAAEQLAKIPPNSCVGVDKDWNYVAAPCVELNAAPEMAFGGIPPQHSKPHLKATATAGTVTVQWTDTSAGPGVGFFIYKGTTSGGESGTPLNSSPVDVGQSCLTTSAYCTYNDTPTPGAQACYTVAANNSSGTSAKASPDACVTVPIPIPPAPVLGPPIVN